MPLVPKNFSKGAPSDVSIEHTNESFSLRINGTEIGNVMDYSINAPVDSVMVMSIELMPTSLRTNPKPRTVEVQNHGEYSHTVTIDLMSGGSLEPTCTDVFHRCRCGFVVPDSAIDDVRKNWKHWNAAHELVDNDGCAYCPRCDDETLVRKDLHDWVLKERCRKCGGIRPVARPEITIKKTEATSEGVAFWSLLVNGKHIIDHTGRLPIECAANALAAALVQVGTPYETRR